MTSLVAPRLDARQRKSRRALYAALDQLLAEKPYPQITVTELVERAHVGRQTFYRHFDNIDAMLEQRLGEDLADQFAFARQQAATATYPEWVETVTAYAFERAGQQPRLYRLILSGQAGSGALGAFTSQIARMIEFAPTPNPVSSAPGADRYVFVFYAGAVCSFLLEWLNQADDRSPAVMGALFARLATQRQ